MHSSVYDLAFSKSELKKIQRLRRLDSKLLPISIVAGVIIFVALLYVSIQLKGNQGLSGFAFIGCILVSVGACLYVYRSIDRYVENQFLNKWDKIYLQRTGSSSEKEAVKAEMQTLTNETKFLGLPLEAQRKIAKKINEKHGL